MRILSFSLLILVFIFQPLICQEENKIWYFGARAGLDFNYDPPKVLTNSEMYADEGCGVVCDTNGSLMFYTNGEYVFNREHQIMDGGFLKGHSSASQNGVVVSYPGHPNLCYVFSAGAQESGGNEGLNYSIIDMTLNDGLGNYKELNVKLLDKSSEKIAIARHANGTDYWIVAHEYDSEKIYAWPISKDGIGEPVISDLNYSFNLNHTWNKAGYLTFNRDYTKMAAAFYFVGSVVLYDFDNSNGIATNPIVIHDEEQTDKYTYTYGVEFSPDGSKLYFTKRGRRPSILYQADISSNSTDDINNSVQQLAFTESNDSADYYCALMLAPDNKIYVASHKNQYIHRIDNPNALGEACAFVENAVYLEGKESRKGLPTRAIAVPAYNPADTTENPDTSDVTGLNPEMSFSCETTCYDPGTRRNLAYKINLSQDIIQSGDQTGDTEFELSYNRFILDQDEPKVVSESQDGDIATILVRDNISSHNNYVFTGYVGFYAGLGNTASTTIEIGRLNINGIEYYIDTLEVSDGCFCINVCNQGGPRLVNPERQALMKMESPNPANDFLKLELELIEKGATELYLIDMLGRKAATLMSKNIAIPGKETVNYSLYNIHSGMYNLVLKTPSGSISKLVMVVK